MPMGWVTNPLHKICHEIRHIMPKRIKIVFKSKESQNEFNVAHLAAAFFTERVDTILKSFIPT